MFADDTTIPLPALYVEATDPATIYTDGRSFVKRFWLDTSTGTIGTLKKRNAANSGWDALINFDAPTIPADAITNTLLANMAQATIKGRASGAGTGDPTDLSAAQTKTILAIVPGDVTGFDTQVRTSRLDQMAAPTADVSLNSHKLTSLTDPSGAQDAATKAYVDAQVVSAGSIAPLVIESANVVAQRNGANAQTFNFYQNYASAGATYNRLAFKFSTNDPTIETESDSGSGGNLILKKGSSSLVWSGGSFTPSPSGSLNLGGSSALWNETHSNQFWMPGTGAIVWNGRTQVVSPAAGLLNWMSGSNSGSGTIAYGSRTSSQITSDQNNYALSLTGYFQRLSSDASRNITGISGGNDGQIHRLVNIGTNPIVLKHDDPGSTAANRFYCSTGADVTLTSTSTAKEAADLMYDSTLQRWLVYKK